MKKFVAILMVVVTLTMSLVMAQAEKADFSKIMTKDLLVKSTELMELDVLAKEKIGDTKIVIARHVTNPVTAGQTKFARQSEPEQTWLQKAVDWLTFWN